MYKNIKWERYLDKILNITGAIFLLFFPGEIYLIPSGHLSLKAYLAPQLPVAKLWQ